ncbi:uncharacterized protein LOC122850707 [Aphidius gifuensis]|uniref:uncharacterized protein LOC122850707 n=1 Tax=Aphidius gifuensis TaxID=684658 RepID=UPI001CDC3CEC|nr:uncharacterized protein LOC122850707 [Aphidius gifuensis]
MTMSNVIFSTASIAESAVEIIHLLSGISTVKFDYKNSINPAEKIAQFKNVNKKFEKNVKTFLDTYHEALESQNETICDLQASPQHQLFSFYCEIIYAHIQTLATLIFSYMWKSHYTQTDFNHLSRIQTYDTLQKIAEYTKLFESKMKKTSNIIRRCDSTKVRNETYAAIDDLLYAFVINQRHFENSEEYECRHSCDKLPDELVMYETFNSTGYLDKCPGAIYDCQAGSSYKVCPRNESDESSTKKYYWMIDNKSGLTYGNTSHECNTTVLEDAYTINRVMQWDTYTCESCICRCVDNRINTDSKTIRAFSYLWSNTSANMVATGARLVVQDRMIHIQLREAKLMPFGNIDKDSERWVPLPEFEYNNYFPSVAILADGTRFPLKRNRHYGKLEQNYGNKICLQKIIFDEKHLLTGVRFNATYFNNNNKDEERCFNIDTNYGEFNYTTGEIMSKKSYDKQQKQPTELKLNQPDDPLKFETNVQDSENNQYIKIGVTDLIKDASQTTIPYFDLQEVITEPSVPLAGLELFHKGRLDKTSGGYVTLKIHPIDLSVHMTI